MLNTQILINNQYLKKEKRQRKEKEMNGKFHNWKQESETLQRGQDYY